MSVSISGDGGVTGLNTVTSNVVEFSGNVSVAGTVTYEDVTNVDSIGVITARSGIVIGTGTSISSPSSNVLTLGTNSAERVRIDSSGNIGINTTIFPANGTNLKVSNGTIPRLLLDKTGTDARSFSIGNGGTYINLYDETSDVERLRISSGGQVYVGQYANTYDNPGRFNISNGSRVSTTSGAYVPSNGGFVDYARYELISTCVTSFPANNNKIMARNGAPIVINNARDTWSHYSNLPNYLIGTLTHDCINNTSFTFTLACTMTVFLLRNDGWNVVDLTGWTLIESGTVQGINAIIDGRLYVKTLAAGTHALSNNSAMYFWLI